jgi:hypothetical protein
VKLTSLPVVQEVDETLLSSILSSSDVSKSRLKWFASNSLPQNKQQQGGQRQFIVNIGHDQFNSLLKEAYVPDLFKKRIELLLCDANNKSEPKTPEKTMKLRIGSRKR